LGSTANSCIAGAIDLDIPLATKTHSATASPLGTQNLSATAGVPLPHDHAHHPPPAMSAFESILSQWKQQHTDFQRVMAGESAAVSSDHLGAGSVAGQGRKEPFESSIAGSLKFSADSIIDDELYQLKQRLGIDFMHGEKARWIC